MSPTPRPPAAVVLLAHPSADRYGSDRMFLESVAGVVEAGRRAVVTLAVGGPLVADLEAAGARVVLCPSPLLSKSALSPRGALTLLRDTATGAVAGWRLLGRVRPDVVYVSTVTVPLWAVLARVRGVPVVGHVHEAERSAHRAVRTALGAPLLLARLVAVNSRFATDVLTGVLPRLAALMRLVPNGVTGPAEATAARPEITGPARLVYVGRLSERKGVDVAVEALGVLREAGVDARLDLVGAVAPGYEWFEEGLRELVAASGLERHVAFHGFQDPAWPFVSESDVVLIPSRTDEPFGNTAVEAVLAARPSVVAASGGLVEATSGYSSVRLVPPGDARALAAEVSGVLERWPAMRAAAIQDAEVAARRHAPEQYRATVVALLDEAAARGGRRLRRTDDESLPGGHATPPSA